MSLALGAVLGVGLLLAASPWLWPAAPAAEGNGDHGRRRVGHLVRDELALAGLGAAPIGAIVVVALTLAAIVAALAQVVFGIAALTMIAAVLGALVLPILVRTRATRRRAANRAVWPETVDHLVASVRAGRNLPDAIGALGDLGPAVTRPAFAGFDDAFRRSGDFGSEVDALKARLADPVADRILETLRMSRDVGGSDLTAVLGGLAAALREDAALRAEVVARQSWIRNAAMLGVAAPWVVLCLLATRPETLEAYDSPVGTALIVSGVIVTVLAYRMMVGLGRLPEERRWFS
ncbi:type II secretion system F family protein [Agromyces sp. SYSU T0242]|uniref:type II secretion system F family protein n=1 Tax=Agromyces litoreus TaxID=3158561 RepID=UPI0033925895